MRCIYSPFALVISAFLTGLAHYPLQLGPIAWVSLVPFIFVLNRITSLKHFIIVGFIWGCTYYLTVIFWLATNIGTTALIGTISMIAAVLYCSFNIILICMLMKVVKNYYPHNWFLLLPFVWITIEYIRNMDVLTGGPWTALANSQLDFLTLAQNVEITGIYGISFWLIFINILIFNWLVRPYPENSFAAISIFILPWITGLWLTPQVQIDTEPSLDVTIVQPNIHLYQ